MTRQVDVKAIVSHVVRGDGINKCRICMGDTSEGQVHLNDTVIMDGDKPVTLSELLETVTGIKMLSDADLPAGVCPECSKSAMSAAEFRSLCHQAVDQWELTVQLLQSLPKQSNHNNLMFALLDQSRIIIINDDMPVTLNTYTAAKRVMTLLNPQVKENSPCQCPNCGKHFQNANRLSSHLKESMDLKRACHICAKIVYKDKLVSHMMDVHKSKIYKCHKCPALLMSHSQYIRHKLNAHTHDACMCVECGRTFRSLNAKYAHILVHKAKSCPSCDKPFRNHACYVHHVKNCCNLDKNREDTAIHRTKNKVMISVENTRSKRNIKVGLRGSVNKECYCDICGKKFAGKKFVAAHIQTVHTKDTHRPCVYCGKSLASAHMSTHLKKHEYDLSFKCEHCNVILKTKLGYTQHLRLHTGERPYACGFCGESFSASSRRSEHIRKVHKSSNIVLKQACHLCPAKFRLPYRLKRHLKATHNYEGESQQQFKCDVCHEEFSSCRGLLHHSRKHQNINFPPSKQERKIMLKVYSEPDKCDEECNMINCG